MTQADEAPQDGELAKLINQQLALAASRLPALAPDAVHPSPVDHEGCTTSGARAGRREAASASCSLISLAISPSCVASSGWVMASPPG